MYTIVVVLQWASYARAVMHVGIANPRLRGKRSRRMHNPHFCVSGKRPIAVFSRVCRVSDYVTQIGVYYIVLLLLKLICKEMYITPHCISRFPFAF